MNQDVKLILLSVAVGLVTAGVVCFLFVRWYHL